MESVNETNIIDSVYLNNKLQIEKNEKNEFSNNEEEESLEEEWKPELIEKKQKVDIIVPKKIIKEETKDKILSNLEFLLSQNDILPLLKKLNKEKMNFDGKIVIEKNNKNVFLIKNYSIIFFYFLFFFFFFLIYFNLFY